MEHTMLTCFLSRAPQEARVPPFGLRCHISKMNKAKRDDYRIEEEMRSNRATILRAARILLRRMQDIKEAEADNVRDLSNFLDAELEYHERCAEELRRVRQAWATIRANTARSFNDYAPRNQILRGARA
ncbi:hypothetical protein EV126DRAFT_477434 [Verticillium dahliae]|nr:hypothetical protein EV126DRAFT_477434 [Verticillium dahliae]